MNIDDLIKASGNEHAGIVEEGLVSDVRSFIAFNKLLKLWLGTAITNMSEKAIAFAKLDSH